MLNIGELCNRSVVIIHKDESALDAATLIRNYGVGDVVIVEQRNGGNVPLAIVTDRDLVVEVMAEEVDPTSVSVADLFLRPALITVSVDDDLETAVSKMRENSVRRVPVLEGDGTLAGILTLDDVLDYFAREFSAISKLIETQWQTAETNLR